MDLLDIDPSLLYLSDPESNDDSYQFRLLYNNNHKNTENKPFTIYLNQTFNVDFQGNSIFDLVLQPGKNTEKLDMINNTVLEYVLENQTKWFDGSVNKDELNNLFNDLLIKNTEPGINKLSVNYLKTNKYDDDVLKTFIDKPITLIINLNGIMFDGTRFKWNVELNDIILQEENQGPNESNPEEGNYDDDVIHSDTDNELNEVDVEVNNIDTMNLNVSDDDYFVLYKWIKNTLYKNIEVSFMKIFKEQQLSTSNFDINDLSIDSDEGSDDELETNDSFEENFNSIVKN